MRKPKTIGILGGVSPESTIAYYERIIRMYRERFGNHSYPEILIYSVSFQTIMNWQKEEMWNNIVEKIASGFRCLHRGGASFGLIAANTLHYVYDRVLEKSPIPLINIIDVTAEEIQRKTMRTVGLLGTAFTMSQGFYKERMHKFGINVLVPKSEEQKRINRIIYDELTNRLLFQKSKKTFLSVIENLAGEGAEGVILGCTEIPLLIGQKDSNTTLFDTTRIHAESALNYSLSKN